MKLPFQPDLSGKVAVVTGGSGVLCSDFCRALAQCGAKVAIINRNLERGQVLEQEICQAGGTAKAFSADVTNEESVCAVYAAVTETFGPCNILVNGAGGNNPKATTDDEFFDREVLESAEKKSFFDLDPSGFTTVFGVNMNGVFLPTRYFARDMTLAGSGVVVNISSMNAFTPLTKIPAYSAAKAAVSNFTKWLSVYLAKSGVRVNAMAPGFFSTQQNMALLWNPDGTPTVRSGKILRGTPMERFGKPEELLGTLLWLVDDASSGFVTGVVVPVDGGFSAYSGV